jgi:hypothetical protein
MTTLSHHSSFPPNARARSPLESASLEPIRWTILIPNHRVDVSCISRSQTEPRPIPNSIPRPILCVTRQQQSPNPNISALNLQRSMAPTDRQQQDPMKTEKAQEAVSSGRNKEKKNQSPPPWQAVPLQEEFTGSNPAPFGSQGQGLSLVPISALLYKSPRYITSPKCRELLADNLVPLSHPNRRILLEYASNQRRLEHAVLVQATDE